MKLPNLSALIYGKGKVGKSTFCSKIPKSYFLLSEDGHNWLDTKENRIRIRTWKEFQLEVIRLTSVWAECQASKKPFPYEVIILDTVDTFYKMCELHTAQSRKVEHVTDLAWGKGGRLAEDSFKEAIMRLQQLSVGIVFIAHPVKEEIEIRPGVKKTELKPNISKKCFDFVVAEVDFILYFYVDDASKQRMMICHSKEDVYCGDRSGKLPPKMEIDYEKFIGYLTKEN